jgi:dTDP-glucose pyrophosphorylase
MFLHKFDLTRLSDLVLNPSIDLRTAMTLMTKKGMRFAIVAQSGDDGITLSGVVTDGDIRRYLTDGGSLEAPCLSACNATPKLLPVDLTPDGARAALQNLGVDFAPQIKDGKLVTVYAFMTMQPETGVSAVIMTGGLGTRLRPLTETCPKPLLSLNGTPILTRILRSLKKTGVTDVTLTLNYLGDMIVNQYGDGNAMGLSIRYTRETERRGTGGSLSLIEQTLSDPFIVMNGDILTDIDFPDVISTHKARGDWATMVVRRHSYTVPYGVVECDDANTYLGTQEKPNMEFMINAGVYVLSPQAREYIPKDGFFDMPTLFEKLRSDGKPCGVYHHDGLWIDIGSKDELERASSLLAQED